MSVDSSKLQETMFNAIDAIIQQRNNDLKLDKTIVAITKKNIGVRNGRPLYQLQYEGGLIQATSNDPNAIYNPNTSVYVLIPQGNFSNEKFIIGKVSTIATEKKSDAVVAAVNRYSIASSNLVKNIENNQYGLHSFHPTQSNNADIQQHINEHPDHYATFILYDKENFESKMQEIKDKYEDDNDNAAYSEAKSQLMNSYWTKSFDFSALQALKEEATGLMIKADFKTNLDIIQTRQSTATYGLIFNFAFNNLNAGYGETQGEILDAVGEIIKGEVAKYTEGVYDGSENKTLKQYITTFEADLNSDITHAKLVEAETGKIPVLLESIDLLYNSFLQKDEKLNTEIVQNTFTSFKALLNELENTQNKEELIQQYQDWKQLSIGESKQKIEQYVLTSNDMIGNPFSFKQWNTQYNIFSLDLKNLDHLDSILFFKQGFVENYRAEQNWPLSAPGTPDIFVKNIQLYAMKPLDAQSGDYSLKIEPQSGSSNILEASNPEVIMEAKVLRKLVENLTYNSNTKLYWFKESFSITSTTSEGYDYRAGKGWQRLEFDGQQWVFKTQLSDNPCYKNNYKCVVVYETDDGEQIILNSVFSIYNLEASVKLQLSSSLGTTFNYGAGVPVIIAKVSMNNSDYDELKVSNDDVYEYKYIWSIEDSANGEKIFLIDEDKIEEENAITRQAYRTILSKIKKYYKTSEDKVEETTFEQASRIEYPISLKSSGFVICCSLLRKHKQNEENFIQVGSDELTITINSDGTNSETSTYRIYIENGDQVFQYDEYGVAPTNEKNKNPLKVLPLKAKLYSPAQVEIQDTNYVVEWIFPIENTMIISPAEGLIENPSTKLVQMYRGYGCDFDIAPLYNLDNYNNQITCHIHFGDKDLYKDTNFYFGKQGSNGTNGTDIVAKINYNGNDYNNILNTQPLTIYVQKGSNSKKDTFTLNTNTLKTDWKDTDTDLILASNNVNETNSYLTASLYQRGTQLFDIRSLKWNVAGNPASTSNNKGKYFNLTNNQLIFNASFNKDKKYLWSNIKVEIEKSNTDSTKSSYYAFYSLPIIIYESNYSVSNLINNRIAISKNDYLNEIVYNADGHYPLYNHNQGLKLINLPSNINKVTFKVKGGPSENENTPSIRLLRTKDSTEKKTSITFIKNKNNWKISSTDIITKDLKVYVIPDDVYNGSSENNRIEAALYNNNDLIATVYAPIHMSLNTFGLTSLNAWDGNSVTIDEDGGYVMAPQIGAGEKDSNNLFTGILMGKTEQYTGGSEKEKQVGLFGYKNGLQSIFLDAETGDAIFGLPNIAEGKYEHTSHNAPADTYGEGRIELRPGGESKIGGWRIGHQTLFYTLRPTSSNPKTENGKRFYDYEYAGTLGQAYPEENHHKKDIYWTNQGILLSADPPYISIKTKRLTVGSGSQYDINQDEENNSLANGDSLELLLDPSKKSFFTIYKHKGASQDQREPLVGIDGSGRFYTNSIRDRQTSLNMNWIDAFGKTANSQKYIGLNLNFKKGTSPEQSIFRAFIFNTNSTNNLDMDDPEWEEQSTVLYLSGGNGQNEYLRPMRLYGESVYMFAYPSRARINDRYAKSKTLTNPDGDPEKALKEWGSDIYFQLGYSRKTSIDENGDTRYDIEDNTAKGYINLSNDTYLRLNQQNNNSFRTYGTLTQSIGGNLTLTTRGDYIEQVVDEKTNTITPTERLGNITIYTGNNFALNYQKENYKEDVKNEETGKMETVSKVRYNSTLNLDKNGSFSHTIKKNTYYITANDSGYKIKGPQNSGKLIGFYTGRKTGSNDANLNKSYLELGSDNNIFLGHADSYIKIGQPGSWGKGRIRIVSTTVGDYNSYSSGDNFAQIRLQAGEDDKSNTDKSYFELNSSKTGWLHSGNKAGDLDNHWFRIWTSRSGSGITGYLDREDKNGVATQIPIIAISGFTIMDRGLAINSFVRGFSDEGLRIIPEKDANGNLFGGGIHAEGKIETTRDASWIKFDSTNFNGSSASNLKAAIDLCLAAASAAQAKADSAYALAEKKVDKLTYNGHTHQFNAVATGQKTVDNIFSNIDYYKSSHTARKSSNESDVLEVLESLNGPHSTSEKTLRDDSVGSYDNITVNTTSSTFTIVTDDNVPSTSSTPTPLA